MKIVVIGGSGLIGSRLVSQLRGQGHDAVAASPSTGVNTLTGDGLADVLKGATVVVDVTNSPSWEDAAVMQFFETSTRNLLAYEVEAGVKHHVALSVVGTDLMLESGFFRAKLAQEDLIRASTIPYSIVRATQFFEFAKGIVDFSTSGNEIRLPPVMIQPMAADDVAEAVALVATGTPMNGTVEVAGPERFEMRDFIGQVLAAQNDAREAVSDSNARYFGIRVDEKTLVPQGDATLGKTRLQNWLAKSKETAERASLQHA